MAILSMNEILSNDVQSYLGGADLVLVNSIMNLTSKAQPGKDRVTIPRISGLSLDDISDGTTEATGGAMTTAGDALIFDQSKEVAEYILWDDNIESSVDLKASFADAAPKEYAQGIENAIYTALATSEEAGHAFNSGVLNSFTVANLGTAKKLLDKAGVPKSGRTCAVNAEGMEILAATQEFQDGQKSLSDEALKEGIVSRVKGFNVKQSDTSSFADTVVLCYHESAVAFGAQKEMSFIQEKQESFAREFISLRGKYGVKRLDLGKRNVVITMAV